MERAPDTVEQTQSANESDPNLDLQKTREQWLSELKEIHFSIWYGNNVNALVRHLVNIPLPLATDSEIKEIVKNTFFAEAQSRKLGLLEGTNLIEEVATISRRFNLPVLGLLDHQLLSEDSKNTLKKLKEGEIDPGGTEAQKALKEEVLRLLGESGHGRDSFEPRLKYARLLMKIFPIQVDTEIQEAAKKSLLTSSQNPYGKALVDAARDFSISLLDEDIQKSLKGQIKFNSRWDSHADSLKQFAEIIKDNKEFATLGEDPELRKFAKELILRRITEEPDDVLPIMEAFAIPVEDSEVQTAALKALQYSVKEYKYNAGKKAGMYINNFHISEDVLDKAFNGVLGSSVDWKEKYPKLLFLSQVTPYLKEKWDAFLQNSHSSAQDQQTPFAERKRAIEFLAFQVRQGDLSHVERFRDIVVARTKQETVHGSKWGLDGAQEVAFYTLLRLDNPENNRALFDLALSDTVNQTVRYAALKKLSNKNRNFFTPQFREDLGKWLFEEGQVQRFDFRELQFVRAILDSVPSMETRMNSLDCMPEEFYGSRSLTTEYKSLYEHWEQRFSNIPQSAFLQIVLLSSFAGKEFEFPPERQRLLESFQTLYASLRKESTKKDQLLSSVVSVLQSPETETLEVLMNRVAHIPFGVKADADILQDLFRKIAFISSLKTLAAQAPEDEDEENNISQKSFDIDIQEIRNILGNESSSLLEINNSLSELVSRQIREILPHPELTAERLVDIEKEWQTLEPIFTYLRRYPGNRTYIAEIVAHSDSFERWKNWRYDLQESLVKGALGHLSIAQRGVWSGEYVAEEGELEIDESLNVKADQVRQFLQDAIVRDRHIANVDGKLRPVQETLERILSEATSKPEESSDILARNIDALGKQMEVYSSAIQVASLPKAVKALESFSEGTFITPSAKVENVLKILTPFLGVESQKQVLEAYKNAKRAGSEFAGDLLITSDVRNELMSSFASLEDKRGSFDSGVAWKEIGVEAVPFSRGDLLYTNRQAGNAIIDILRLYQISAESLARNRLPESGSFQGKSKKSNRTIVGTIENLKQFFKKEAFLMDLENISSLLEAEGESGKRSVALVITDRPQMLWQAGKYPLGNGSCQHYAEGSMAEALIGYVGDAHTKTVYMVDLNKLPAEWRDQMKNQSFSDVAKEIPPQALLEASIARTIIKLGRLANDKVAIFLEPTYTSVNKSDQSLNKLIENFVRQAVGKEIGASVVRGGGKLQVRIPASRNRSGQYEDGAEGNAGNAGHGIQQGSYTVSAKTLD